MSKDNGKHTAYRSAVDGRFITKKQAERNPRESVKERIQNPKSK